MNIVPVGRAPIDPATHLALLFGGTFDPPHRAHIELPALVRDALGADVVLYIPAGRSPHKPDGPVASGADRLEMLRLALGDAPRVAISTIELDRDPGTPSYTIDTLRALRAELPDAVALRLLIGADQAAAFHRWREPQETIRLAEPAVMLRTPHESAESLIAAMAAHWGTDELARWRRRIVPVSLVDAEATDVRGRFRTDPDAPELGRLIPGPVLAHIRARGLYR